MNKQFFSFSLWLLLLGALFTACEDDSAEIAGEYQNGLLIVNAGNFLQSNGSLSFLPEGEMEVQQNVFQTVNGNPLRASIESVNKYDGRLFIVANMADKIVVTNAATLELQEEITSQESLTTPRYMVFKGDKAYVSVWGPYTDIATNDYSLKSSKIAVIDLNTLEIETTIPVPSAPEGLQLIGDKLFVAHTSDSLSVINTATNQLISKVATVAGASHPVLDDAGKLWVTHSGGWGAADGYFVQYNQNTLAEEKRITLPGINPNGKMQKVGDVLYFSTGAALYKIDLDGATATPELVVEQENLGTFWVDEVTGDIYLGIKDSANPGTLLHLNAEGVEQHQMQLGPFPYQIIKL